MNLKTEGMTTMPDSDKKVKILCLPYSHTLSHISRPLAIAQGLRRRGHEIIFAGESSKTRYIRQEGFTVLPLHEPDPELLYGNIRSGKLCFVSDAEIERMIEADLALYREVKPDLVLSDGRFSAPLSTHIAGLKHAAIVNVSSTEYRALPYIPFFEQIPTGLIKRDSRLWRSLDSFNLWLEMLVFDNVMSIFKKLSRKLGLTTSITATNCLAGKDLTLLSDVPEYFPTRNLPANYHYIGPLTWKSASEAPAWWPPDKGDRPLIYITMGTTGIGDFFHTAYDLFKTSDMAAIVTTGGQAQGLETIKGKLYLENFIDGDLVMDECDLVVCHGGNGTIYQALQHGKPIIGIPTIPDQQFNMRRVEALGIGRSLSWEEFSKKPTALLDLIAEVLKDQSCQRSAIKFKDILAGYDARRLAADIIEKALM